MYYETELLYRYKINLCQEHNNLVDYITLKKIYHHYLKKKEISVKKNNIYLIVFK